jgi:hypothetical protein
MIIDNHIVMRCKKHSISLMAVELILLLYVAPRTIIPMQPMS